MNPIDLVFANHRRQNRAALMPFLAAGDPDLAFTANALQTLMASGASLIEVGVPFSDPVADGPVIQASYTRALANGFKVEALFETIQTVSAKHDAVPMVAMASYSLIYKRGVTRFVRDAQAAGFHGVVVPDLPVEEADDLAAVCKRTDFKLVLLVTPTTSPARAEQIVKTCTGFVYVVSVVGITGARSQLAYELKDLISKLRTLTDLPLCVGFGISTPEHVKEIAALADGVIVGSAIVKLLDQPGPLDAIARFTRELSKASLRS